MSVLFPLLRLLIEACPELRATCSAGKVLYGAHGATIGKGMFFQPGSIADEIGLSVLYLQVRAQKDMERLKGSRGKDLL